MGYDHSSRRTILKSIGVATISAFGSYTASGTSTTEIVWAVGKDRTITKRVPTEWYEHEQKAKKVKKDIEEKYEHSSKVSDLSLGRSSRYVEGKNLSEVSVYLDEDKIDADVTVPAGKSKATIPDGVKIDILPSVSDKVDGVPVSHYVRQMGPMTGCYGEPEGNSIFGGHRVYRESGNFQNTTYGTISTKVEYFGEKYILTCQHIFEANDWDEEAYYIDSSDTHYKIGELVATGGNNDWALIDDTESYYWDITNEILRRTKEVNTHLTEDGCLDIKSNDDDGDVYKRGATFSAENGTILDVGGSYEGSFQGRSYKVPEAIGLSHDCAGGDSGGPLVVDNPDGSGFAHVGVTSMAGGESDGSIGKCSYDYNQSTYTYPNTWAVASYDLASNMTFGV